MSDEVKKEKKKPRPVDQELSAVRKIGNILDDLGDEFLSQRVLSLVNLKRAPKVVEKTVASQYPKFDAQFS